LKPDEDSAQAVNADYFNRPVRCDTSIVTDWLIAGARSSPQPEQMLSELSDRLSTCGIPLWQVELFVRTLHPDLIGRRFRWRADDVIGVSVTPFALQQNVESRESIISRVCSDGLPLRRQLFRPDSHADSPLLRELRDEGVSDVLACPLVFTDGDIHTVIWTTREPRGFTEDQLAGLAAISEPLARVTEIQALKRTAHNLLDTYTGSRTGERILAGEIRRGHTEAIHAAIWLSDMRGFTALSDRIATPVIIDLLNRYFDCQVPGILQRGGEVLEFMGDGLLAMFPIDYENETQKVCADALAAAMEARTKVAAMDLKGIEEVKEIRFGLALHVGEVLYGNIGGGNRLDFTCIGPAVNLAARLEKVAAELGRTIVTSSAFAAQFDSQLLPLGEFTVRGFHEQQTVFGLTDEA
jgi:adenylate cyclase